MPALSDTLSRALGINGKVRYYLFDAGRAWRRKGKAAQRGLFFWLRQCRRGWFNDAATSSRHSKQEEERCASQARSSGSTTPRVTDSSNATEAVTSSCTTPPSRATASDRSRRGRQWSSRSLTARRARRPATSPSCSAPRGLGIGIPNPYSFPLFTAFAVKFTFPFFTATRNDTSAPGVFSFFTWLFTRSANLWNGTGSSPTSRRASATDSYSS